MHRLMPIEVHDDPLLRRLVNGRLARYRLTIIWRNVALLMTSVLELITELVVIGLYSGMHSLLVRAMPMMDHL